MQPSDIEDPHEKAKRLLDEKNKEEEEGEPGRTVFDQDVERVRDNFNFANKVENEPVVTKEFDKNIFGVKVLNFNHYILQQAWPSSFYFIDKLIRLNTKASMEWQKRYLSKKRTVPMKMIWLLIVFVVIIFIIVLIWLLLPRFTG